MEQDRSSTMRRCIICLTAAFVIVSGAVAAGQGKMSLEAYAALMKSNAQANGALNKAIGSASYADARTQVGILRKNFFALRPFWAERKRTDAVDIVRDGLSRLAAMEELLGRASVPQAEVQAAAKEF